MCPANNTCVRQQALLPTTLVNLQALRNIPLCMLLRPLRPRKSLAIHRCADFETHVSFHFPLSVFLPQFHCIVISLALV